MPELPEVEVTRQSLQAVEGATVSEARLGKPLRWPLGCAPGTLARRQLGAVQRRGKYLWLPLTPRPGRRADDGGGLLMHLGMSGSLQWLTHPAPAGPHDHFDLVTNQGTLRLHDPRRFGAVVWSQGMDRGAARQRLQGLGAEPFDTALGEDAFFAALKRRRASIKQVLLSGQVIVGAGNIYACEALYQAGIDPRLAAHRVSRVRAGRLLAAVRATLARAIRAGGTTLRDFQDAQGTHGAFQHEAQVYGREGQSCGRCGRAVSRIVQAQRSTYFCRGCQSR